MLELIWSLLILLLLIYVWFWFIKQWFSDTHVEKKHILTAFLFSTFIVFILFFYKQILSSLGLWAFYFWTIADTYSLWLFILYCIFWWLLISFFVKWITKKDILFTFVVAVLFFIALAFGAYILWFTTLIISYFLSVYAEELLKFLSGKNIFLTNTSFPSNLIFYCIIVAFSFSIVENFLYILIPFFSQGTAQVWIALWRWIFSSLLHIVATGMIAYISIKPQLLSYTPKKKLLFLLLALLCWVAFHLLYNLSLTYHYTILLVLIILFSYFFLSFFLFQTSTLYKKK